MYLYVFVGVCMYLYVFVCICMCLYVFVCMYLYVFVCICIISMIISTNIMISIFLPAVGSRGVRLDKSRHRLNGYLAQRVPSICPTSSSRTCLNCAVLTGMFPWISKAMRGNERGATGSKTPPA